MRAICEKEKCTACGACETVCPKKCIRSVRHANGSFHMEIDEEQCISCGLCTSVCPVCTPLETAPAIEAYAARRTPAALARDSASGGVASAIYEYAVGQGMACVGVVNGQRGRVGFEMTDIGEMLPAFKNSRYTFSHTDGIYKRVCQTLKQGKDVFFVGLPCQVAAMRRYADTVGCGEGRLYLADLVCHGTPPPQYLEQHLKALCGDKDAVVSFRDPRYSTDRFYFSLAASEGKKPYYKKSPYDTDVYQIGYHNALIYRDVCYGCAYANAQRVGDITLGDYHGLGNKAPWQGDGRKLSLVLVNTQRGKELLDALVAAGMLNVWQRPTEEPIQGDPQLRHPSVAPAERETFVSLYEKTGDFETAAKEAFRPYVVRNRRRKLTGIPLARRVARRLMPRGLKQSLKKALKKKA